MDRLNLVKILISMGANINASLGTVFGRTALQAACERTHPNMELIEFLLANEADVNALQASIPD